MPCRSRGRSSVPVSLALMLTKPQQAATPHALSSAEPKQHYIPWRLAQARRRRSISGIRSDGALEQSPLLPVPRRLLSRRRKPSMITGILLQVGLDTALLPPNRISPNIHKLQKQQRRLLRAEQGVATEGHYALPRQIRFHNRKSNPPPHH